MQKILNLKINIVILFINLFFITFFFINEISKNKFFMISEKERIKVKENFLKWKCFNKEKKIEWKNNRKKFYGNSKKENFFLTRLNKSWLNLKNCEKEIRIKKYKILISLKPEKRFKIKCFSIFLEALKFETNNNVELYPTKDKFFEEWFEDIEKEEVNKLDSIELRYFIHGEVVKFMNYKDNEFIYSLIPRNLIRKWRRLPFKVKINIKKELQKIPLEKRKNYLIEKIKIYK